MKNGDYMTYETLNAEFEANKMIRFKLYSMEYIVEQKEDCVEIYDIYYECRKAKYSSLRELLENYTFYNQPLINLLDKIKK